MACTIENVILLWQESLKNNSIFELELLHEFGLGMHLKLFSVTVQLYMTSVLAAECISMALLCTTNTFLPCCSEQLNIRAVMAAS